MLISRRSICVGAAALLVAGDGSHAENGPTPAPSADVLDPGDFLWSKPRCSWVPFQYRGEENGGDGIGSDMSPEDTWEYEKKQFLKRAAGTSMSDKQIHIVETMSFGEFLTGFHGYNGGQGFELLADHTAYDIANFFRVYCGHAAVVGMPDSVGGPPQVVEAEFEGKVVKKSYTDFLKDHLDDNVFHGRLTNYSKEDRAHVATKAKDYLGTPYEFFNFNLRDKTGVYCSKLPWLCVYDAFNIALDNKSVDGVRWFWFTPKMMVASQAITMLGTLAKDEFAVPSKSCKGH